MKHYKIYNINDLYNQNGGYSKFLTILSYNVSWEAITSLLKQCSSNGICKTNILYNIKYNIKKYNPDFAFFQEASEHNDILNLFNNNIYDYYVNTSDKEYMISLWNKQKFTVVNMYNGNLEKGRPFAIIILANNKNKQIIALINIHAGHYIDTETTIFKIINNFIKKNISSSIKKSITRVIMGGDFNRNIFIDDTSNYTIQFSNDFELIKVVDNKNTCCSILSDELTFNFDHVLDSYKPAIQKIVKHKQFPASDHMPIIVKLSI
jgi:endonuclease/exonuclease/phosphatase family metal-dependent hydrolase